MACPWQAHQVLREFGHRAEEQAMQSLVDAWQVVDPEMVNSTSLLSGEQGLVMNLLKPGALPPCARAPVAGRVLHDRYAAALAAGCTQGWRPWAERSCCMHVTVDTQR